MPFPSADRLEAPAAGSIFARALKLLPRILLRTSPFYVLLAAYTATAVIDPAIQRRWIHPVLFAAASLGLFVYTALVGPCMWNNRQCSLFEAVRQLSIVVLLRLLTAAFIVALPVIVIIAAISWIFPASPVDPWLLGTATCLSIVYVLRRFLAIYIVLIENCSTAAAFDGAFGCTGAKKWYRPGGAFWRLALLVLLICLFGLGAGFLSAGFASFFFEEGVPASALVLLPIFLLAPMCHLCFVGFYCEMKKGI